MHYGIAGNRRNIEPPIVVCLESILPNETVYPYIYIYMYSGTQQQAYMFAIYKTQAGIYTAENL